MNLGSIFSRRSLRLAGKLLITYVKINWRLFVAGLITGVLIILLLPKLTPILTRPKGQTIGLVGNYTISTLPISVQNEISFGLTKLTADGQATPAAATSWQATDSGRTIIFDLSQNLFWQDGTKFDASQINYNLRGVSIKRLALYKVQFVLKDPFAPLPVILSQPLFKNGLVGLGAKEVEGLRVKSRFINSIDLVDKKSRERKIYKFYPNEAAAATALKLGAVDEVRGLHQTYDLEKDNLYRITEKINESQVATVFFNLKNDFLAEKNVRQALTYALPDSFLEGRPADSPIAPSSWAFNANVKKYPRSLDPAKKVLGATSSASPKLIISAPLNLYSVARTVAQSWTEGGFKTEVITADILPPSFDVYIAYLDLPPDPDQYALWHSTQTGNITGYKSPKIDKFLEDGRKTLDQTERKAIYADFQRAITEDVPATFLFYPKTYTVTRKQ